MLGHALVAVHNREKAGHSNHRPGWARLVPHAPEVQCIGKGNAAAPYELGVNASIVTNNRRAPGGLFVLHARALPDKSVRRSHLASSSGVGRLVELG